MAHFALVLKYPPLVGKRILLGLHSVLIYVSHPGGVIRTGWFQSVPEIK